MTTANGSPAVPLWRFRGGPGPVVDALNGYNGRDDVGRRAIVPTDLLVEAATEHAARLAFLERWGLDPGLADYPGNAEGKGRWIFERADLAGNQPYRGIRPDRDYPPPDPPAWQFLAAHHEPLSEGLIGLGAGILLRVDLFSSTSTAAFAARGAAEVESHLETLRELASHLPGSDSKQKLYSAQEQVTATRRALDAAEAAEKAAVAKAEAMLGLSTTLTEEARGQLAAHHLDAAVRQRRTAAELRERLGVLAGVLAAAERAVAAETAQRDEWLPRVRQEAQRLRAEFQPRLQAAKARIAEAVGALVHELLLAGGVLRQLPPAK